MNKLIFGCGYLGQRVAQRWLEQGHVVHVVTRSAARAEELRDAGFSPIVADVAQPDSLRNFPPADEVLYAIGYDRHAGASRQAVQVDGLRAALDAVHGANRQAAREDARLKLVFISTTGVYSQGDGSWINENSPCEPQTESGRACLAAEEVLRSHPLGARGIILRLAGIYGPGRLPRRDLLQQGKPVPADGDSYLNLIHVDDAASIILAAFARAIAPALYLVSDGHPVLRRDYYAELARLIGAPPPCLIGNGADLNARRGNSDKRISNARLIADLAVTLQFPTFRPGLAASLTQ